MSELREILALWKRASAASEEVCLATVVGIEGSAYRRPGARMLVTARGERAGTISGGCLEAEIVKKAWWLTQKGPSIQRYSSFYDDDGDVAYGLGCGGTVMVLLERGEPAEKTLDALRRSLEQRARSVVVVDRRAESAGTELILTGNGETAWVRDGDAEALNLAAAVLRDRWPVSEGDFFVDSITPPAALYIYGAGDDAQPLVNFAAALDWWVTVADGRAQLARRERFPQADSVVVLGESTLHPEPEDAAVIMTHSYEQDARVLEMLLPIGLKYLGILGPRLRTDRLLASVAPQIGMTVAECRARLHSPVGLDLGGHSPATIALSIVAELQAVLSGRVPRKLTEKQPVHA